MRLADRQARFVQLMTGDALTSEIFRSGGSQIEMHLEAREDLAFMVSDCPIHMRKDETIHTENSHKYSPDQARLMLQASGWPPIHLWSDPAGDFMLILADATEHRSAP